MYQRVKAYIREQKMLKSEDRVIAGVSGGADSICLLFILLELKKELGFELMAVHVHHGLRGSSADADEEYVKKVCRDQKVQLFVFHEDVAAYAKNYHLTPEEAGRKNKVQHVLRWRIIKMIMRKLFCGICVEEVD